MFLNVWFYMLSMWVFDDFERRDVYDFECWNLYDYECRDFHVWAKFQMSYSFSKNMIFQSFRTPLNFSNVPFFQISRFSGISGYLCFFRMSRFFLVFMDFRGSSVTPGVLNAQREPKGGKGSSERSLRGAMEA